MARRGGTVGRLLGGAEEYLGVSVRRTEEVRELQQGLQEATEDVGTLRREMGRLGYADMNHAGGQPHELTPKARMAIVAKGRVAWSEDPQLGAAVDLRNAFVFGRGVPKPQAHDDEVQDVVDATFADPANRRVLTSHAKLVEKGVDMALQANVYLLFYDGGPDGRVRMSLAEHDTIVNAVRHPDDRMRILYYKAVRRQAKWDWGKGEYVVAQGVRPEVVYYEALDAFSMDLDDAVDPEDFGDGGLGPPPEGKLIPGKLHHLAVNKGSEALFGVPRVKRMLRWLNAYEQTLRTSVDLMKAAASVYMKADVKGGRRQVERASNAQVRRASPLTQLAVEEAEGNQLMPRPPMAGPSVLYENAGIQYSPFKIDSHASESATLAGQARMQISAGSGLPSHYTGDATNANLATATSIEVAVLATIGQEQEVWEGAFRTLTNLAIRRAVESGWLSEWRDPTDEEAERIASGKYEDDVDPETGQVKRDLGYDFSLPNPLKRMMADLTAAISTIAATVDPTNQNVPLSRFLLGLALEQAFDIQDPKRIVDKIFPPGYEPPAPPRPAVVHVGPDGKPIVAPSGNGGRPGQPAGVAEPPTTVGADGKRHAASNPYGAYQRSGEPGKGVQETAWFIPPEELGPILEEAAVKAHRGLRPRADDPTFKRYSEEFLAETTANLGELVSAARGAAGSDPKAGDPPAE